MNIGERRQNKEGVIGILVKVVDQKSQTVLIQIEGTNITKPYKYSEFSTGNFSGALKAKKGQSFAQAHVGELRTMKSGVKAQILGADEKTKMVKVQLEGVKEPVICSYTDFANGVVVAKAEKPKKEKEDKPNCIGEIFRTKFGGLAKCVDACYKINEETGKKEAYLTLNVKDGTTIQCFKDYIYPFGFVPSSGNVGGISYDMTYFGKPVMGVKALRKGEIWAFKLLSETDKTGVYEWSGVIGHKELLESSGEDISSYIKEPKTGDSASSLLSRLIGYKNLER